MMKPKKKKRINEFLNFVFSNLPISDKFYTYIRFFKNFHHLPDLKNPKTFNEKILLLNTSGFFNQYTSLADKYEVRDFVEKKIGKRHLVDLYGVYDSEEDINFENFPEKFVLKATHGSHWNLLCKDKKSFDTEYARRQIRKWLSLNYYKLHRETLYKDIPPRIICENFIEHEKVNDQLIFEIFCFHGRVEFTQVVYNRFTKCEQNYYTGIYYDRDWKICPFRDEGFSDRILEKPDNLDKMINVAESLAEGMPFVRVDLYTIKQRILFGELTYMPAAGYWKFDKPEMDNEVGSYLNLSIEI